MHNRVRLDENERMQTRKICRRRVRSFKKKHKFNTHWMWRFNIRDVRSRRKRCTSARTHNYHHWFMHYVIHFCHASRSRAQWILCCENQNIRWHHRLLVVVWFMLFLTASLSIMKLKPREYHRNAMCQWVLNVVRTVSGHVLNGRMYDIMWRDWIFKFIRCSCVFTRVSHLSHPYNWLKMLHTVSHPLKGVQNSHT